MKKKIMLSALIGAMILSISACGGAEKENVIGSVEETEPKEPLNINDETFTIEDGNMREYKGNGGDVIIPDGVTSISGYAFKDCKNLTSVEIPDGVISIGDFAFNRCVNLTSVKIPDGVISIGCDAFSQCKNLTSVKIPDSVTSIGNNAFENCESLTSIEIPDSVTNIGFKAFKDCSSLTSVTISDSTDIFFDTFSCCFSLKHGTINASPAMQERILDQIG